METSLSLLNSSDAEETPSSDSQGVICIAPGSRARVTALTAWVVGCGLEIVWNMQYLPRVTDELSAS